ncbi:MAG: apolipoprotein N-acyltransferase [Elainellaceae cyanobacterium]
MAPLRQTQLGSPLTRAIALVSGIAMALSVEPVAAWPLAWVAIAPLWVLIMGYGSRQSSLWDALRLGALWSIGYYGLMLSWVTGLHPLTWMGVPWLASVAIALLCWGAGTLYCTAWTLLWLGTFRVLTTFQEKLNRPFNFSAQASQGYGYLSPGSTLTQVLWRSSQRVLLGAALWCGMDWLWRNSFLYWPSLALTQSPHNLVILHLSQWAGPDAVAIAIIAVNGFLAESWIGWHRASMPSSTPSAQSLAHRTAALCGAIALILFISLHGLGAIRFASDGSAELSGEKSALATLSESSSPIPNPLSIGMIQGNVPTRIKLYEEGLRRAFQGYTDGYETLVDQGVDAVLTPEGAFPIIWNDPIQTRTPLYRAVRDRHIPLWLGTFFPEGRDFTQSLISLNRDAEVVGRYSKVKLVPFGEYIPFEPILGAIVARLSPLDAYMIPGKAGQRFDTPFGLAIVGICYESAFPQIFRQQAQAGGEFILTASNNDPYGTAMMAQHHAQDVMRAIETDRWAVRATNTGYSGVVDHHGRTLWRSQPHIYQLHQATIGRRDTLTPYVRWGDWLTPTVLLGAIASLALSWIGWAIALSRDRRAP